MANNTASTITYQQMENAAATLKTCSSSLKTILDNVTKEMNKINTSNVWKSDAAAQLSSEFRTLTSKFEGYYTKIMEYSKFLTTTVNAYKQSDAKLKLK